jgi:2-dehydropantoate 2-reductase
MPMRITIIGVGAMGSLFAGRLANLADITMLGNWEAQLQTLNRDGLSLIHPDGRTTKHRIKATNNPNEIETADLVLILVKSPNTAAAAQNTVKLLQENTLVITLQNGLGNLETIASIVGPERAAQGVTSEGASMIGPGVVRHAGAGQTYLAKSIVGSERINLKRTALLKQIGNLFNEAGLETALVENADSLIWGKLAVNAGINPLTALLQVQNGFLIQNEEARWLMHQTAAEVAAVAQALGIPLPYPNAAERAEAVARATAANFSSMAQDAARQVPTEIESICGAVVAFGQQQRMPTPYNKAMLDLIRHQTAAGQWQNILSDQPPHIRRRLNHLTGRK